MEIKLTVALPRDKFSVPVIRKVLKSSMDTLGVMPHVVFDIEVALTEACTNVLEHSGDAAEYEVSAGIDHDVCVIEVVDRGAGFDADTRGLTDAGEGAEDGRGIQLIRALVDSVTFVSIPKDGTIVHLEKRLEWQEGSVIKRLTVDKPATEHGPWSTDRAMAAAPERGSPRT